MDAHAHLSDPRTAHFAKEYLRLEEEMKSLDRLEGMDALVGEERELLWKRMEEIGKRIAEITEDESFSEEGADEIILEVRAGSGGDEAAIFARDLAAMYGRYAEKKGYAFSEVSSSENGVGGYKEASFRICGKGVYDLFRFETGVHRVQRVPATEKSGRIHTSAASVAVLPIRKTGAKDLDMHDVTVEFSRSGGAGGQNVNKVESAVRMVHVPTGLGGPLYGGKNTGEEPGTGAPDTHGESGGAAAGAGRRGVRLHAAGADRNGGQVGENPHLQHPAGPGDGSPD